jgi:N utilization substance protein A
VEAMPAEMAEGEVLTKAEIESELPILASEAETVEPVQMLEETIEPAAEVEPVAEIEALDEAPAVEAVEEEAELVAEILEEEPTTLDEIFALRPEVLEIPVVEEDSESEDEESADRKKKKGKKKKKFVEIEYDPDKDVVFMKKKHKRGGDWEEQW